MREPLLWFFLIGVILFGADNYFSGQEKAVLVDERVRDRLNNLWQVQTGSPASKEELDSLVQNWIREEVLFREAKRLGLDRDDSIVRRRLVQKLGFLVEEVEAEEDQRRAMQKYYVDHIEKYSLPVRYSFAQIFFSDNSRAAEIKLNIEQGADWRDLSETSMLSDRYVSRNEMEIAAIFGRGFSTHLYSFVQGKWVGPIRSSFGFHLIRLERILPTEITPLAYIESKVFADYLQYRREAEMEEYFQDLLGKYEIVIE